MLTKNHAQEGLSRAYMHAVASAARVLLDITDVFDYGIDGKFDLIDVLDSRDSKGKTHRLHLPARCPISFQLKSSTKWRHDGEDVVWPIGGKDYNKLVSSGTHVVPVILILLCLPHDETNWASFSENELLLQRCCYYMTVEGQPLARIDTTKQLKIPRANLLNVVALRTMLEAHRERMKLLIG